MFQSTLPRRERRVYDPNACKSYVVSIHAPTQGATTHTIRARHGHQLFQSTLPRRERRVCCRRCRSDRQFQSTLPRRERLYSQSTTEAQKFVSIHAPTQGATPNSLSNSSSVDCFNPRSHAGSDTVPPAIIPRLLSFNPRSHAGSDLCGQFRDPVRSGFNPRSHAGSDACCHGQLDVRTRFNPRSHAGSDQEISASFLSSCVSIHAPTQGATVVGSDTIPRITSFNPRSHAGSDLCTTPFQYFYSLFQSTLPRRERPNGLFGFLPLVL